VGHDVGPVAVLCALEEELRHLREALPPGSEQVRGGRSTWHTDLDGRDVILARCGMGMLSAAAVAESVIGHYGPAAVLNFGCVGAHRADLLPGDMVVGSRVVVGTVLSADRWNRSPERIAALVERHGSHCEDMEAAAIALTCASHDVPFLTVKDVSNNELLKGSVTESGRVLLDQLGAELGRRAGALTLAILRDLATTR
jgi:nucleoside phosphorylase